LIARKFKGWQRDFTGGHFWAKGYFVSTVDLDANMVIKYIRNQEKANEQREQLLLGV